VRDDARGKCAAAGDRRRDLDVLRPAAAVLGPRCVLRRRRRGDIRPGRL